MPKTQPSQQHRPSRVALIGVTGYGRMHFQELTRLAGAGQIELVTATVINPNDAPEQMDWLARHGAKVFQSYQHMLDEFSGTLDLCCIPTAISMHRPMTEAALAAGANVLIEKPLAGCPEDAEAIVDAAKKVGKFVAVGFQAVWSPLTARLLEAIHSGQLGRIQKIAVRGIWPRPTSYFQRNGWAGRLHDAHGVVNDSPANNALAHFLNLALLFSGPAPYRCARVTKAQAELSRANDIENYDTILAKLETETGTSIYYAASHASDETFHPVLDILGEKGRATWSMASGELQIGNADPENFPGGGDEESRPLMFAEVARAAGGGEGLIFPASEALAHVDAINAISQSATIQDRRSAAVPHGDLGNPVMTLPGIAELIHERAKAFLEGAD